MSKRERYAWSQDFDEECPYEEYDRVVDIETDKVLDDFDMKEILNQQDSEIEQLREQLKKSQTELAHLQHQLKMTDFALGGAANKIYALMMELNKYKEIK